LENNGLLSVGVKFNIANRKQIGVTNKVRQLSLDYKVVNNNFKQVVNDYINNGFATPVGIPYFASVRGLIQTFYGTYNGVKLKVDITADEFGDALAVQTGGQEDSSNYLKVVTYKFHQAWLSALAQPNFVLPQPRQNLGTTTVTESAVAFDAENPSASRGLFLFKPNMNIFDTGLESEGQVVTRSLPNEMDMEGRDEPPVEIADETSNLPLSSSTSNSFSFLSRLPLAFTVLERDNFVIPTSEQGGAVGSLRQRIQDLGRTIAGTQPTSNIVSSNIAFSLDPAIYPIAVSNINSNEKIERDELVLTERKTDFFMDQYDTISSLTNAPFVFSFFENNARYERSFVDASYLAACLDFVVLQHIRKTHSMRIVYNSMQFVSYQQKTWFNIEESFCKKIPLRNLYSKTVPFNPLISGEYPGENVNTNANLMFTADFSNTQGVFYKTNRFISCTAFESQSDIQNPGVRNLWEQLETAFSSPVVLSTYPLVGLIPCFSRGEIIQTSETVLFKGLVSNSGSEEGF